MQKVNDPKHSSKPSTEWLGKKKHGAAMAQLKPTSKEHAKTVMEETQKSTPSSALHQDPAGRLMSHSVSLVSGPSMESKNFFLKT